MDTLAQMTSRQIHSINLWINWEGPYFQPSMEEQNVILVINCQMIKKNKLSSTSVTGHPKLI